MPEPFRYETRVRFADTDASGRIHYTALFRFFEAAETELFRSFGIGYTRGSFNFPRVHAECDIRLALVHDDWISVEVCLTKLGSSSLRFEFQGSKRRRGGRHRGDRDGLYGSPVTALDSAAGGIAREV